MNWHIGQRVLYFGSTQNGYVHDDEMTITGIKQTCHGIVINADNILVPSGKRCYCGVCGKTTENAGEPLHFHEKVFAPLMDISELESILKEEKQTT